MGHHFVKTEKGMKIPLAKIRSADIISQENDWPHWFWWVFWLVIFFPMWGILLIYGLCIKKCHVGLTFRNGSTGTYDFDNNELEKIKHWLNISD
jgi:hypothetical protein